jgi:ankyrin repeat protein
MSRRIDTERTAQRWVRELDVEPGHWKKQLPTKHLALATKSDGRALRALLSANPEFLNRRGNHGRTLLWEATRAGKLANVKFLDGLGADVELTGCYNSETLVQISPMCASIHYERRDVAAFLESRTSPHDIFQAAFLGDSERVRILLRANPDLVNVEDDDNEIYFTPPLTFAIAGGSAAVAQLLLDAGAEIACYCAQLFHVASMLGRIDLLELLFARGADPTAADTSVFVVARELSTVRWLLDHGVPVNRAGMNGSPPVVYLTRGDKGNTLDRVRLLLEHGAHVDARGPGGRTALHHAAAAGALDTLELLLASGADRRAKDDAGLTPLATAVATGKISAAELLR